MSVSHALSDNNAIGENCLSRWGGGKGGGGGGVGGWGVGGWGGGDNTIHLGEHRLKCVLWSGGHSASQEKKRTVNQGPCKSRAGVVLSAAAWWSRHCFLPQCKPFSTMQLPKGTLVGMGA